MKKIWLFFIVVVFCSCVSESTTESINNGSVVLVTDFGELMPDAKYRVTFWDGKKVSGTADKYGVIIVKAKEPGGYTLLVDLKPSFDNIEKWQDIKALKTTGDYEVVYLNSTEDGIIFISEDGTYTVTLVAGKNYYLIFSQRAFDVSM